MSTHEGGRFYGGHVALSRKISRTAKNSGDPNIFFGDPHLLSVWIFILTMANWRDGDTIPKGRKSIVNCGQVLTCLREIGSFSKCGNEKVRRKLKILKKQKIIDVVSEKRGTLITIIKYKDYQDFKKEVRNDLGNKRDTNETQTRHRCDSIETSNKENSKQYLKEINKENLETLESNKFVDDNLKSEIDKIFETMEKPKIKKPKKSMIKTWTTSDPLAKIFENLNQEKKYRRIFDYPKDKAYLKDCGIEFDLSIKEIEGIAKDYAIYFEDKENAPKSPRSSFRNFCKNVAQRKAKNKGKESDYLRGGMSNVEYVEQLQGIIDKAKRD